MRADAIRQMYENPKSRALAETLMDVEADHGLRYEMIVTLNSFE